MKYLLDTHVWLWALSGNEKLGPDTRSILEDHHNLLYLSSVSSWEITIKWQLGKIELPEEPQVLVRNSLRDNHLRPLDISHKHGCEVASLPAHHKDPFDRLLIAQAQCERLVLITADAEIMKYGPATHWAPR